MSEIALLLDEIRGMKRRLQALETVQEHPGFAASDVARLSIANTFADTNTFESDVIVEGDLTVDQDAFVTGDVLATGIVQAAAAWIPGVAVSLDAKLYCGFNGNEPYETDYTGNSHGHRGQASTKSGGLIYRPGKFGKAVQIAEATTNLFSNPSFETNTSFWFVEASATITRTNADALFGSYCVDYARTGSASSMYNSYTISGATAGRVFTHSGWVKAKTSSDVGKTLSILIFEVGGASGSAFSSTSVVLTSEWQRITLTRTVVQNDRTSIQSRFQLGSDGNCYVDGAQLEEKSYATPYCDGSLGSGHSWSGTAHASTSSRTRALLSYALPTGFHDTATVAFWVKFPHASGPTFRMILDVYGGTNRIYVAYYNSTTWRISWGGNIANWVSAVTAETWYHVAFSWDQTTVRMYIDGVERTTVAQPATTGSGTLQLYGAGGATENINGLLDDFIIISRALSADEIRAIYESNVQLICS